MRATTETKREARRWTGPAELRRIALYLSSRIAKGRESNLWALHATHNRIKISMYLLYRRALINYCNLHPTSEVLPHTFVHMSFFDHSLNSPRFVH